jgi:GNAT superfamily N-acetyltransferase
VVDRLMVRKAVDGDREAILQVTLAAYQEYEAVMPPLHWRLYRENITSTLAEVSPAEQFVAELGGEVVGTVLLYPQGSLPGGAESGRSGLRWPEVRLLAVDPQARGQGIGEALVERCIQSARAAGAGAVTLHTNDMMVAAVRLYLRMGFERVPELDFSPVGGVVIMGYRYIIGP